MDGIRNDVDYVSFNRLNDMNDTLVYLKNVIPKLGKRQKFRAAMDPNLPD